MVAASAYASELQQSTRCSADDLTLLKGALVNASPEMRGAMMVAGVDWCSQVGDGDKAWLRRVMGQPHEPLVAEQGQEASCGEVDWTLGADRGPLYKACGMGKRAVFTNEEFAVGPTEAKVVGQRIYESFRKLDEGEARLLARWIGGLPPEPHLALRPPVAGSYADDLVGLSLPIGEASRPSLLACAPVLRLTMETLHVDGTPMELHALNQGLKSCRERVPENRGQEFRGQLLVLSDRQVTLTRLEQVMQVAGALRYDEMVLLTSTDEVTTDGDVLGAVRLSLAEAPMSLVAEPPEFVDKDPVKAAKTTKTSKSKSGSAPDEDMVVFGSTGMLGASGVAPEHLVLDDPAMTVQDIVDADGAADKEATPFTVVALPDLEPAK
jgi:hypothetical protein